MRPSRTVAALAACFVALALLFGGVSDGGLTGCGDECPCEADYAGRADHGEHPAHEQAGEHAAACTHDDAALHGDEHEESCPPDCERCHAIAVALELPRQAVQARAPHQIVRLSGAPRASPLEGTRARLFRPPRALTT